MIVIEIYETVRHQKSDLQTSLTDFLVIIKAGTWYSKESMIKEAQSSFSENLQHPEKTYVVQ